MTMSGHAQENEVLQFLSSKFTKYAFSSVDAALETYLYTHPYFALLCNVKNIDNDLIVCSMRMLKEDVNTLMSRTSSISAAFFRKLVNVMYDFRTTLWNRAQ